MAWYHGMVAIRRPAGAERVERSVRQKPAEQSGQALRLSTGLDAAVNALQCTTVALNGDRICAQLSFESLGASVVGL